MIAGPTSSSIMFTIAPSVAELFPEMTIAVVTIDGPGDAALDVAALNELRRSKIDEVRSRLSAMSVDADPAVTAWRQAYRRFGANPRKHPPSTEVLLRRVSEDRPFHTNTPLVDVCLIASIEFRLPVGGYDLSRVNGDISLRLSPGGEAFVRSDGFDEHTDPGEVICADRASVIARRWNQRHSNVAAIRPTTTRAVLFCESPSSAIPPDRVVACACRLTTYAERVWRSSSSVHVVDGSARSMNLP